MPNIFLSYSREDQAIARRYAEGLEREGFSVWWDQALTPGEAFDQVTEKALEEAGAVVVLWSKTSVNSRWVRAEATQANANGRLMPVMIESCKRPIMFELSHSADLSQWEGDAEDPAWQTFVAGVRRVVQRNATVGSATPLAVAPEPKPASRSNTTIRGGEHGPLVSPALVGKTISWRLYASWAAVILVALMAGFASRTLSTSVTAPPAALMHLSVDLGPARLAGSAPVAISPDGTRMVFATGPGGLYLRDLSAREFLSLRGTEGAREPFFSPDEEWVGFSSGGKLRKVAVSRGEPVTIADVAAERGFSWSIDGTIVFGGPVGPLMQVSDAGGTPRPLTTLDVSLGEASHRWPFVLPDRRGILFAAGPAATSNDWNSAHIVAQSLETGERRVVAARGTMPMFAAGYLIYLTGHTLVAQRFDLKRLDVEGPVFTLIDDVERAVDGGGWFSISRDAVLLHVRGPAPEPNRMAWVSRSGQLTPLPTPPAHYNRPSLSPDGQRIAVTISDPDSDIWTFDVASGGSTRITNDGTSLWPMWTPDGTSILYSSTRISEQGGVNLYQTRGDGTGNEELLLRNGTTNRAESWSPGGDLAFMQVTQATGADLLTVHLGAQPSVLRRTRFEETGVRFSPDGRWMAYMSTETGRIDLYAQPLPLGTGEPVQIFSTGSGSPVWSKDGGELFFSRGNELWVAQAPRRLGEAFGPARLLTSGPFILATGFDVAADGRFLVVTKEKDRPEPVQIDVTLNWTSSLQSRSGQRPP